MIKEDRIGLNNRFIEAFKLLEDRGAIIKNDRGGKGVGDVADRVLGNKAYGHIIRAFLNPNSKRVIDYGQASSFCRAFDINEAWMLHGIGNPFGFDAPGDALTGEHERRRREARDHCRQREEQPAAKPLRFRRRRDAARSRHCSSTRSVASGASSTGCSSVRLLLIQALSV